MAASEQGTVTVDDAALFFGRIAGGTVASFEATRFAAGRKNALRHRAERREGQSLAFDLERMNELEFYDGDRGPRHRRVPPHPRHRAEASIRRGWWPPGHGLGYEHSFVHEVVDFVRDIGRGRDPVPSFADGL